MKLSLVLMLALSVVAGAALTACNTTAGAGQDVKAAGQGISRGGQDLTNSANRNQ